MMIPTRNTVIRICRAWVAFIAAMAGGMVPASENTLPTVFPASVTSVKLLASVEVDDLLSASKSRKRHEEERAQKSLESSGPVQPGNEDVRDPALDVFRLDERTLVAELRQQLARQFAVKDDFRVHLERPWKDLVLATPDWELVITTFPSQGLRSQFFVRFEIWAGGKRHTSWQEGVRCELWLEAYTATQRIERGTPLREGLFVIQPVNVLALFQSPVEIGISMADYVVATGIQSGDPLYWRDLAERPLVERNSIIDVVASEGMMRITLKGKALETGVRGQVIRVRNLQSASDIQAEVTGVNQARVHF
jgi:flagella basal body P-ring formation protein FlgA